MSGTPRSGGGGAPLAGSGDGERWLRRSVSVLAMMARRRLQYFVSVLTVVTLAATMLVPLSSDSARAQQIKIITDKTRPKITQGPFTNSPSDHRAWRVRETLEVYFTFSEPLVVTGKPRLLLRLADGRRWAKYKGSVNTDKTLVFAYRFKTGDAARPGGVLIPKNALRLHGARITDFDGNAARIGHAKSTGFPIRSSQSVIGDNDLNGMNSMNTQTCADTTATPTTTNTGLVADCDNLLAAKGTLEGSGMDAPNLNWSTSLSILEWEGVYVTGDTPRVVELSLDDKGLTGSIPTELGNLTNLKTLELNDNRLTGSIPTSLGNLTDLEILKLSVNQLTGSIPTSLGNLTKLKILKLDSNRLIGGIPTQLGSLTGLVELHLAHNPDLGGTIPVELGALTALEWLLLKNNGLTGSIPDELSALTKLNVLSLAVNKLTGSIPAWLGDLELCCLGLQENRLTGSIPPGLGDLSHLRSLSLRDNRLSGEIPPELGCLYSLKRLRLAGGTNSFTGTVPLQIQHLGISNPTPAELRTRLGLPWATDYATVCKGGPAITLHLSPDTISEGQTSVITAKANPPSDRDIFVRVWAEAETEIDNKKFKLGWDQGPRPVLKIPAGKVESTGRVTIDAVDDISDNRDRHVTVGGTLWLNRAGARRPEPVTLTILDNDDPPQFRLEPASTNPLPEGGSRVVYVRIDKYWPDAGGYYADKVTVTARPAFSSQGASASEISLRAATYQPSGSEWSSTSSCTNNVCTLDVPKNRSGRIGAIEFTSNGDNRTNPLTYFNLKAEHPKLLDSAPLRLAVADNDALPEMQLLLSPDSITENGGRTTVTARLNELASKHYSVTVQVPDDCDCKLSGHGTTPGNKVLTFERGSQRSTGSVTITADDNNDHPRKNPVVKVTSDTYEFAVMDAELTIIDDDGPRNVHMWFEPGSTIYENNGLATVHARLDDTAKKDVTVTVALSNSNECGCTISTNKTLRIAAGQRLATGEVTVFPTNKDVTLTATVEGVEFKPPPLVLTIRVPKPRVVTVDADWPLIPRSGSQPLFGEGDSFRLLFVTSVWSDAQSSDVRFYNKLVQDQAARESDLYNFRHDFRALVSTSTVDARDNTATTGVGVPIYWLRGDKVADDYTDFYDGTWDSGTPKTTLEQSIFPLNTPVWHGSNLDGTKHRTQHLGTSTPRAAAANSNAPLSSTQTKTNSELHRFYALSPVIVVSG